MRYFYMFKNLKLVLALILCPVFWLGAFHQSASAETAIINCEVINVRSGPGISYGVVGQLSRNNNINILERRNGWLRISSGSMNGWVAESLTAHNPSPVQLPPLQIYINGNLIDFDVNPVSANGCTLVPLRTIFENLGATITWDNGTQTITARKSATKITLSVGSDTASINGQIQNLDVPVQIRYGKTLVPLRFAAESIGGRVIWDGEERVIDIYCPPNPGDKISSVVVTAADVNLRSGPSITSDLVGLVPNGARIACVAEQDGWYQVKYQGQLVWIAGWLVVPEWGTGTIDPSRGASTAREKQPTLLPVPADHKAFVVQMKPYAEIAGKGTGLPINFLLAQWAEESGYGTSALAQYYNNFGGIKDSNTGGFKKYLTAKEFAQDVINVYTQNSNYNHLLSDARDGASIQILMGDLASCHYASSPNYTEKIKTIYLPVIDEALGE